MTETPEADVPEVGTVADLIPASLPDTFLCWVEEVHGAEVMVTAPVDAQLRPVDLPVGDRIDLVWRGGGQLRCLPVELTEIRPGERPCWRLAPAGVAKRGQRRDAVRAPMTATVTLGTDDAELRGTTVDVSEGGLRCVLERRPPTVPAVGEVVRLTATLGDLTVRCLAEVTRHFPRDDDRADLSLRFIGLTEHEQDRVRERIFARLRELRRRGLL
jgi:hypothetical protein